MNVNVYVLGIIYGNKKFVLKINVFGHEKNTIR